MSPYPTTFTISFISKRIYYEKEENKNTKKEVNWPRNMADADIVYTA